MLSTLLTCFSSLVKPSFGLEVPSGATLCMGQRLLLLNNSNNPYTTENNYLLSMLSGGGDFTGLSCTGGGFLATVGGTFLSSFAGVEG